MFEICLASLRAREKWVFFCCLNVGDLGINGVNMSGLILFCVLIVVVVDIFVWLLLLSYKLETEVDDDDNLHMV